MNWSYPNFTKKEVECRCGCGKLPEKVFMEFLQDLRYLAGHPLVVSSAARCAKYNSVVSGSGLDGPHVRGLAADLVISGAKAFEVMQYALGLGVMGLGVNQKGLASKHYLHVDLVQRGDASIPRPMIWSY